MRPPPSRDIVGVSSWVVKVGAGCGILTLTFFMIIVAFSTVGFTVPDQSKFLVVVVFSLGLTLSGSFIGGAASLSGKIPIPFARAHPLTFAVTGGIATFLISSSVGYWFYVPKRVPSISDLMLEIENNNRPPRVRQNDVLVALNELRLSDWHGRNLSDLKLNPSGWANVNLEEANLSGVVWEHAGLRGVNLVRAHLDRADLRFADFRGGELNGAIMRDARCSGAFFQEVWLRAGNYKGTDFSNSDLSNSNLQMAEFSRANFDGANLADADFNDSAPSNLSGASFRGADLRGTDLRGTIGLESDSLDGAIYDDRTEFPKGFQISGRGLRKMT